MTIRIPKGLLLVLLGVLLASAGGAAGYSLGRSSEKTRVVTRASAPTSTGPDSQTQWNAREGQDWTLYQARFYSGFYQGCQQVFALSDIQGGTLTDSSGRQWTMDDCYKAKPNIETTQPPDFPPRDPGGAGLTNGENEGCKALVLKTNSDLKGVTIPGKPFTDSLNYCDGKFPLQYS
jgi:hypothetical protein